MALQTYPQSPKQRVEQSQKKNYSFRTDDEIAATDRFGRPVNNAASTPEQQAEGLRLAREFGLLGDNAPSSGPGSNPVNPLALLVASLSDVATNATNEGQAALQKASSDISKFKLDEKISEITAGAKSGLNQLAGDIKNFGNSAMGGNFTVNSAAGGAIDKLKSVAGSTSNIGADIVGTLNKLTGGNLAGGLMKAAGGISAAAGMLNNVLSLKRAANLPEGAEVFVPQGEAMQLTVANLDDWRVRIDCEWSIFDSLLFQQLKDTGGVVWPYLPNITVSTKAEYSTIPITHGNYAQYSYKNSVVDDITISGEFSCETNEEGAYWIAATTFFKTATKMFFGQGALAGNPPIICKLSGYGSSIFKNVPVVIKSFSVDLKDDVNYIRCEPSYDTADYTWVPTLSTITVVVAPVYTRQGLRKFNLQNYAAGQMAGPGGVGYI
jgi:hypothetical protein